jgi:hypothetical protein
MYGCTGSYQYFRGADCLHLQPFGFYQTTQNTIPEDIYLQGGKIYYFSVQDGLVVDGAKLDSS